MPPPLGLAEKADRYQPAAHPRLGMQGVKPLEVVGAGDSGSVAQRVEKYLAK